MNREETLDAARHAVTGRDDLHGTPEQSFEQIALMWGAILRTPVEAHEVALCMAALKIVRASNNPDHDDNWTDLAGYAACGAECAHIAQGSRCVSDTGSDGKTVAENTNANTDPVSEPYCGAYQAYNVDVNNCLQCRQTWRADEPKPCQRQGDAEGSDDGWIDHDGSDRCPVTDGDICVEVVCSGIVHKACVTNWQKVDRWRIAEVDGWVRWSGGSKPLFPANAVLRVVFRNGLAHCHWRPDALNWSHSGSNFDIIAYRPA